MSNITERYPRPEQKFDRFEYLASFAKKVLELDGNGDFVHTSGTCLEGLFPEEKDSSAFSNAMRECGEILKLFKKFPVNNKSKRTVFDQNLYEVSWNKDAKQFFSFSLPAWFNLLNEIRFKFPLMVNIRDLEFMFSRFNEVGQIKSVKDRVERIREIKKQEREQIRQLQNR